MSKRQNIFYKNRNIIELNTTELENNTMAEEYESQIQQMQNTIDILTNQLKSKIESISSGTINPSKIFTELGNIPDIVKEIPQFDGNPRKLIQWIEDVDYVIEIFAQFRGSYQYDLVLRTIRRKIVGEANSVLVNNNTILDWENIRETLTLHYSDKRDLMSLTVQLVMLTRKNDTIETYHAKVQEMKSLIISSIQLDNTYKGCVQGIIKLYSNICLETFIRGIGPMSPFLKSHKPTSLAQAFQYAIDFQNTDFKSSIRIPSPNKPIINYENIQSHNESNPLSQRQKFPRYEPQYRDNKFQNTRNYENERNLGKPEPMEINKNNHSRFTNYSNKNTKDTSYWRQHNPDEIKMSHMAQVANENEIKKYLKIAKENTESLNDQFENSEINFRLNLCQEDPT